MHTFEAKNTLFHFDGGMDGDVIIATKENPNHEIRIDAKDLIEFIVANLPAETLNRLTVEKIVEPPKEEEEKKNFLTLKWGTLKSWHFDSPKGIALMKEYDEIGSSISAMAQHDTPRQKEIICELIDECDGDTIYLHWDGKDVSKQEAKEYVMDYGTTKEKNQKK